MHICKTMRFIGGHPFRLPPGRGGGCRSVCHPPDDLIAMYNPPVDLIAMYIFDFIAMYNPPVDLIAMITAQ